MSQSPQRQNKVLHPVTTLRYCYLVKDDMMVGPNQSSEKKCVIGNWQNLFITQLVGCQSVQGRVCHDSPCHWCGSRENKTFDLNGLWLRLLNNGITSILSDRARLIEICSDR